MNEFTQPKGALDAIGEALRLLLKGQITKEQYAEVCKPVTPVVAHTPSEGTEGTSSDGEGRHQEISPREQVVAPRGDDRVAAELVAPPNSLGQYTTHTVKASGKSQKARLLRLLLDGEWHDSPEIIRVVYGSNHLVGARYPARLNDLSNDGWEYESDHVKGSLWRFRLIGRKPEVLMFKGL